MRVLSLPVLAMVPMLVSDATGGTAPAAAWLVDICRRCRRRRPVAARSFSGDCSRKAATSPCISASTAFASSRSS